MRIWEFKKPTTIKTRIHEDVTNNLLQKWEVNHLTEFSCRPPARK